MQIRYPALVLCLIPLMMVACQSAEPPGVADAGAFGDLCQTSDGGPCSKSYTLNFGGLTRSYILHIPPYYKAGAPLMIVLHGSGNTAAYTESMTGLDATADLHGFAIAYANAAQTNTSYPVWNIYYGGEPASAPDDVGFLRQLIATLGAEIQPDPKRIYVAGFSIGASMAERAGVELSDLVAAVASVEGTLKIDTPSVFPAPPAVAPVSVLFLHGDATDEQIPFCGGPNIQYGGWNFASQEATFDYWSGSTANQCATLDPASPLCDAAGAISQVVTKTATDCRGQAEVKLYRLVGGDHLWYSTPMNDPAKAPYNPDLNAQTGVTTNDIVWNFLAAHPKP